MSLRGPRRINLARVWRERPKPPLEPSIGSRGDRRSRRAACGSGLRVTRHPGMGAVEQRKVAEG